MWDRFLEFYDEQFDDFRGLTTAIPEARDVALKMKEEGFKVVIASNPFWPLRVQMKRLAWAGIEDIPYDHITHIENTSFLKPRPEYYANISDEIDVNASECMMVGNDPVNDMIASTVGMKTYLTTDSRGIDPSLSMSREIRDDISITIPDPDFTGPLRDVPQAVCSIDEI